ncbi:Carboxylesterase YbfK [Paraburkholderia domus]|nr:Carboxylesterase YbfK [Paraburkholderia domus]
MPVIFLHGFTFDASSWDPQFAALDDAYLRIRYDLRGFGRSSDPIGKHDHGADLLSILRSCDVESAHLVGLSLGADVALSFALSHPEHVRGLLLASPGLPGFEWRNERPPDGAKRVARLHGIEAGKAFWLNHPVFASARERPDVAKALLGMVNRYRGWHWSEGAQACMPGSNAPRLPEVRCPTLIINGMRDVTENLEIGTALSKGIESARRLTFGGTGHLVNMEAPERFNQAMLRFLVGDPWLSWL